VPDGISMPDGVFSSLAFHEPWTRNVNFKAWLVNALSPGFSGEWGDLASLG
jgi:hypothetical protein